MRLPLYAPKSFWDATCEQKKEVCNGCGAKGGIDVPDTMYLLSISVPCNIHDWCFYHSQTLGDMIFSNAMFLYNLSATIINESNWLTVIPRLSRATKYFLAVVKWGKSAFWIDKVENNEMQITLKGEFR